MFLLVLKDIFFVCGAVFVAYVVTSQRTNPPSIERREENTSDGHACLCSHPLWWS